MSNYKLPPRQKMINLLYVILIAMLAINISGDVLDGFITANEDMKNNVEELKAYNEILEKQLTTGQNGELAQQAIQLKEKLLAIDNHIIRLKDAVQATAQESSFSNSMNVDDDLNAVKQVMLKQQNASGLKTDIEKFKEECLPLATNEASRKIIGNLLNTDAHKNGKTWEEEHFANLPVIGCKMMMNKIRKDLWLAFNETMRCVAGQIAINDSLVLPQEKTPQLDDNLLQALLDKLAEQTQQHKIVRDEDGRVKVLVMTENQAPLFANYENLINVTIVSENPSNLTVNMSNGSIRKEGDHYVAIPNGKSRTATLTVKDGDKVMTQHEYQVLPLPAPTPALIYSAPNGKQREYRSSVPLSRQEIQSISQIRLNMNGGVNTKEKVSGFDLMLIKNGNKTVEMAHANGAELTPEMKKILGNAVKGDKLIFHNISLNGPHTPARQTVSINVIPM